MSNLTLAFDRSARTIDADGRLHVARSHISKAAVNPYYGREIPGFEALGLDEAKVYKLLRDPAELEKGAATFARLPVLSKHVPVTVEAPRPDLVVGAIGSDVVFDSPYLDADLSVWDAAAIAGIETGAVKELSCAYRYVPVMEPGTFEGQAYDGRMTEIRGNHLALVEVGRAGSDVVVSDSNPFHKDTPMKMTKLGKALIAALSAASAKLAQDSALPGLVGGAEKAKFDKPAVKAKLIAMDSAMDPQQLDNVIDALLDVEQSPEPVKMPGAVDQSPSDKLRALLAGKVDDALIEQACALVAAPASDETPPAATPAAAADPAAKPAAPAEPQSPTDKPAMDAAIKQATDALRAQLKDAADAARAVRPVVGDVVGMDSAAEIFGFALDQMGVAHKDITDVVALRALFNVASQSNAPATRIAQDSTHKMEIKGLGRFNQSM